MHSQLWRIYLFILLITFSCSNGDNKDSRAEDQNVEDPQEPEDTRNVPGQGVPRGLISKTEMATPGYILFSSIVSDRASARMVWS